MRLRPRSVKFAPETEENEHKLEVAAEVEASTELGIEAEPVKETEASAEV